MHPNPENSFTHLASASTRVASHVAEHARQLLPEEPHHEVPKGRYVGPLSGLTAYLRDLLAPTHRQAETACLVSLGLLLTVAGCTQQPPTPRASTPELPHAHSLSGYDSTWY